MSLAREYFLRVLSPWASGVHNPLPAKLEGLGGPERTAIDVGSGPGVLLCLLAQSFGRVIAVDQDAEMVESALELVETLRRKGATFGEIEVLHADWASCDHLRKADLVCAVNSILEPHRAKRRLLLELVHSALRPGGTFLGIFPAMEAQIHLLRLYAASLADQGLAPPEVIQEIAAEFFVAHSFDALEGTFASRGESPQKFVYELELAFELRDAGLEVAETNRVIYPWEVCREVDAGTFPGETELWDWFVMATCSED